MVEPSSRHGTSGTLIRARTDHPCKARSNLRLGPLPTNCYGATQSHLSSKPFTTHALHTLFMGANAMRKSYRSVTQSLTGLRTGLRTSHSQTPDVAADVQHGLRTHELSQ